MKICLIPVFNNTFQSRRNDGPCASSSSIQYKDSPYSLGQTTNQNTLENTTWKLTALMSLVKLLSTFGFSLLILFVSDISPFPENFEKGTKKSKFVLT
jgi:hypothetical protein